MSGNKNSGRKKKNRIKLGGIPVDADIANTIEQLHRQQWMSYPDIINQLLRKAIKGAPTVVEEIERLR